MKLKRLFCLVLTMTLLLSTGITNIFAEEDARSAEAYYSVVKNGNTYNYILEVKNTSSNSNDSIYGIIFGYWFDEPVLPPLPFENVEVKNQSSWRAGIAGGDSYEGYMVNFSTNWRGSEEGSRYIMQGETAVFEFKTTTAPPEKLKIGVIYYNGDGVWGGEAYNGYATLTGLTEEVITTPVADALPISEEWYISEDEPAQASLTTNEESIVVNVINSGDEIWDIELKKDNVIVDPNYEYTIGFTIEADSDCSIYAKIGQTKGDFNEYWHNNFQSFNIEKGVILKVEGKFIPYVYDAEASYIFQLGNVPDGTTITITDLYLHMEALEVEVTPEPTPTPKKTIEGDLSWTMPEGWYIVENEPAQTQYEISEEGILVTVINSGNEIWDIELWKDNIYINPNNTYKIGFTVEADNNCNIYAKIGQRQGSFNEYWNNNWMPISLNQGVPLTVKETFVPNHYDEEASFSFLLGRGMVSEGTTLKFTNMYLYVLNNESDNLEEDKVVEDSNEDEEVKDPEEDKVVEDSNEDEEVKDPEEDKVVEDSDEDEEIKDPEEDKVVEDSDEDEEIKGPQEGKVDEDSEDEEIKDPQEDVVVEDPEIDPQHPSVIPPPMDSVFMPNSTDAAIVRRIILGIMEASEYDLDKYDLNGDGKINSVDYVILRRAVLGIITLN
ncbi:UNVERIFIED_CONTAM: carbohydrate binding protein [Acetivibrio alkalicellulosi]